jgi:hypothetical protein
MTAPLRQARTVTCPVCLDQYPWDDRAPLEYSAAEGKYLPAKRSAGMSAAKLADARRWWYIRCPNPSGDSSIHHLPVTYADYADPLVVALVGRPRSGKTHLAVAMIKELLGGTSAGDHGLRADPLDFYQHEQFKSTLLDPFERSERLDATRPGRAIYTAILVLEYRGVKRSLVFYDVAGEDFKKSGEHGQYTRFLINTGGVLFVEDVQHIVGSVAEAIDLKMDSSLTTAFPGNSNESVQEAVSRIPATRRSSLPAVVVLTKSDRLRYRYPVDRWIRARGDSLSPQQVLAETRDVYAFLHSVSPGSAMLKMYNEFDRCTMHFVSATGGAVDDDKKYPAGIRSQRVMVPLLSLLAMTGMVDSTQFGRADA